MSTPQTQMARELFQETLNSFGQRVIPQTYKAVTAGTYEWPIGTEYAIRVVFPDPSDLPTPTAAPFTLTCKTSMVGVGHFDLRSSGEAHINEMPSNHHINEMVHDIKIMLARDEIRPLNEAGQPQSENQYHHAAPAMLMNDFTDLNDEWVEWYRKQNVGASYAKAVHVGLGLIRQESKKLRSLVDKYTHNN